MTLITIILTIMLIVIINKNLEGGGKYVSTFQGILIFCYVIFLGRHACLYPIVISAGLSQSSLFVMAYFWGDMRACLYIQLLYLLVLLCHFW